MADIIRARALAKELLEALSDAPPEPAPVATGNTLGVHGQVETYFPATIRANFSQRCRIQAFAGAGGGGSKISAFMALDGGELKQGNRWEDIPAGVHTLYFSGGVPDVKYTINAIPA